MSVRCAQSQTAGLDSEKANYARTGHQPEAFLPKPRIWRRGGRRFPAMICTLALEFSYRFARLG